tara:strand:- start:79 stop:750 length:672 start_codon:yes stop_codon:yes gene_type:complete
MHLTKSKKILVYIFFLLFVGSINNVQINHVKLNEIKNINVSGLSYQNNKIILNEINKLNLNNIFSLDKSEIKKIIENNNLVEKYEVTRVYPSTLNIKIKKTNFLAKINQDNQILLVGSNGKLSKNNPIIENLPFIFGKPNIKEFLKFIEILNQSQFKYDLIKNFYFYKSKRWDLKLKNNILIKLPKNNVEESLNDVFEFLNVAELNDIKIFDVRVKNQIILND